MNEPRYVMGWGSSLVLGEDEDGEMRVPSFRDRRRRGEPWWRSRYDWRKPWHWLFWIWTRLRGGPTMIHSGT